jgi:hypothetical protein
MVICVASTKLNHFLEELVTNHKETKPAGIPVRVRSNKKMVEPVRNSRTRAGQMWQIGDLLRHLLRNLRYAMRDINAWGKEKVSNLFGSNESKKNNDIGDK